MDDPPAKARTYVILGSHACRSALLMLDLKAVAYETVRIPTGLQAPLLRLLRFPERTVPALRAGGQRVQTNRAIARFLDRVRPLPPLFPADPELRRAVEEAERWGDEVLQMTARRLVLAGARDGGEALIDRAGHGRLGPLLWDHPRRRMRGMRIAARYVFDVDQDAERRLLGDLPTMLDRVDEWIEEGVLSGDSLYAADFVIAPSLALLSYRSDVRPLLESRPALALADRLLPEPAAAGQPAGGG